MRLKENLEIKQEELPFKVDPAFGTFLNVLTDEELGLLEKSIKNEGCRDPLVIWKEKNILVGGYHRLHFCQKHNKHYRVIKQPFANEMEAKIWIIEDNKTRRGHSDSPYYDCEKVIEEFEDYFRNLALEQKKKAGKSYGRGTKGKVLQPIGKAIHTDKELAKLAGWSSETIRAVRLIMKYGKAQDKELLRARRAPVSIKEEYQRIKSQERWKIIFKRIRARQEGKGYLESAKSIFDDEEFKKLMEEERKSDVSQFRNNVRLFESKIDDMVKALEVLQKYQKIIETETSKTILEQYEVLSMVEDLLEKINLFVKQNK